MELTVGIRVKVRRELAAALKEEKGCVTEVRNGHIFDVLWDNGSSDSYNKSYIDEGYIELLQDWILLRPDAIKVGLKVKRSGKEATYSVPEGTMGVITRVAQAYFYIQWENNIRTDYEDCEKILYQAEVTKQTDDMKSNKKTFLPGDRVQCIKHLDSIVLGSMGTVVPFEGFSATRDTFRVCWDTSTKEIYNLADEDHFYHCGYGYYPGTEVVCTDYDYGDSIRFGEHATVLFLSPHVIEVRTLSGREVSMLYRDIQIYKVTNNTLNNDDNIILLARTPARIERGEVPKGSVCSGRKKQVAITSQHVSYQAIAL